MDASSFFEALNTGSGTFFVSRSKIQRHENLKKTCLMTKAEALALLDRLLKSQNKIIRMQAYLRLRELLEVLLP